MSIQRRETTPLDPIEIINDVIIKGDLAKLTSEQKIVYYNKVCESMNLNPLTKPFEYITLNGKVTLYALKAATEQLRQNYGVSIEIKSREVLDDIYVVTAHAKDNKGREDESIGAVSISGLKGEAKANAFMKAETKAKRRVTLSITGLGILDESEIDSIADARVINNVSPFSDDELITEDALEILRGKMKEANCTEEEVCEKLGVISLESIAMGDFKKVIRGLETKIKKSANDSLPINKLISGS